MDNLGQLIICGISGTSLNAEEVEFIKNEKLGGIILFSHNFESPAQLAELVNSIQKHRDEYPLFISVDHEGGSVMRFKGHFTQFPSMLEIASLDSPKIVFEVHQIMAKELAACGINLSFSPCCDVLTHPDNSIIGNRSYGADSDTVEKFISAAIRGLQTNGLLSCAKHFPGHGGSDKNSHTNLPQIKTSLEELRKREISPFVKASKSRVEFMMMGHMLVEAIDNKWPTSLSSKAYELLRQETKFSKIIITDDMDMKAISDNFATEVAALKAIDAGADMLVYRKMENAQKAILALKDAFKKKSLKREEIQEKLAKIEKCKKENLSNYQPIYIPKITESFNTLDAKKLMEQLKSISLVRA